VNRITVVSFIRQRLTRRPERRPAGSGWASALARVVADLENLNRSTERDFLAVGEKLIEFRSEARQISSDMAALSELISGEQGRHASHALARMLEHSRAMDTRIERGGEALGRMSELSRRIRGAFSGLHNTVSVFRTLCTLTRIETSRLGSAGADLGHLTAEVGPLSESIQSSGQGVMVASGRLDHDVQCAIRSGAELRATQLKELPVLIASVIESLRSLEERRKWAVESSERQAAEYAAVCGAIDDLVGSIQFHDITRQQIEHVMQTLGKLRSEREGAGDTGIVLTLQSTQLSEAARIFAASIERLQQDLEGIAMRVGRAPEASRALLGVSGDGHDSFFLQLEDQFSAILRGLGTCTSAQAEMESTAASLEETIGRMRDSIEMIRGIEIRIQRISTNASIRATHLGAEGTALNVIAEEMQRLALESSTKTEDVAGALQAMSEAALRVSGGLGGAECDAQSITSEVIGEMRHTLGELHSSGENSVSRVNQIAALGAKLSADIGALQSGFSAGRMFAEVVECARTKLAQMGAQSSQISWEGAGISTAQQLEDFAKTYTMQRQRDVHDSVVGGAAMPAAAVVNAPGPTSGDGELGANVELF
jgi:hypothetical protein